MDEHFLRKQDYEEAIFAPSLAARPLLLRSRLQIPPTSGQCGVWWQAARGGYASWLVTLEGLVVSGRSGTLGLLLEGTVTGKRWTPASDGGLLMPEASSLLSRILGEHIRRLKRKSEPRGFNKQKW